MEREIFGGVNEEEGIRNWVGRLFKEETKNKLQVVISTNGDVLVWQTFCDFFYDKRHIF